MIVFAIVVLSLNFIKMKDKTPSVGVMMSKNCVEEDVVYVEIKLSGVQIECHRRRRRRRRRPQYNIYDACGSNEPLAFDLRWIQILDDHFLYVGRCCILLK